MYAQILKKDMRVNLIGGEKQGLPIDHPDVICVDIWDRTDVELGMTYDPEADTFYMVYPIEPPPEPPTVEDRLMAVEEAILTIL